MLLEVNTVVSYISLNAEQHKVSFQYPFWELNFGIVYHVM